MAQVAPTVSSPKAIHHLLKSEAGHATLLSGTFGALPIEEKEPFESSSSDNSSTLSSVTMLGEDTGKECGLRVSKHVFVPNCCLAATAGPQQDFSPYQGSTVSFLGHVR